MINTIVGFDDNDDELGDYFEQSYNYLNELIDPIGDVNLIPIQGLDCSENHLIKTINSFEEIRFVFVGLLHGNEEQLGTENDVFVDIENVDHFKESLFYSPACSTANKLGHELIIKDCFSYVGCTEDIYATYDEYHDVYIDCENHCLKEFLSSNQTIETCFDIMMGYFDDQIDKLSDMSDEILVAMELTGNKDSFILLGNKQLTKSEIDTYEV